MGIRPKGMAKHGKKHLPPPKGHEVMAPKALIPLMQAFHVDSEKVAKDLIMEAANTLRGTDCIGTKNPISKDEIEMVSSLMKGINPTDTLETLYAAQIVVSHLFGMRKLSETHDDGQRLGLNFLRFSNEAIQQLNKKRNGGLQNITVNYTYNSQENAVFQAVTSNREDLVCQSEE